MAEETKPSLITEALHKIGFAEYIQRFKFGGFVGKLCVLGGLAVVTIGAVALRLHSDWLIISAIGIIALLAALVVLKVSAFADKHPELAMFEGAEILKWEQIKLAAKGVSTPALGAPVPEPADTQLKAEDPKDGEPK
jgi:hypothetical protein